MNKAIADIEKINGRYLRGILTYDEAKHCVEDIICNFGVENTTETVNTLIVKSKANYYYDI